MADQDKQQGLVVSIDLGELWTEGNVEERILDVVATKLVERVDKDAHDRIHEVVNRVREEGIRDQIEPIIREALEKPMQPTNQYGEPRPGADPVTLPELIETEVNKFLKSSTGRGLGSGSHTKLDELIEEAVGRQFKTELKKAVDDAKVKALGRVREAAGEVIAEAVKRAGGML